MEELAAGARRRGSLRGGGDGHRQVHLHLHREYPVDAVLHHLRREDLQCARMGDEAREGRALP